MAIFWLGTGVWVVSTVAQAGVGGLAALGTALYFVAMLLLVGSATRTVTASEVASLFCLGGFMMGLAYLGARGFSILEPDTNAMLRKVVVPVMEETLKILPVLLLLWRGRKTRLWTLGATDVMLLAGAAGAGFAFAEDAYIRHTIGWHGTLAWLPVTEIEGSHMIAGHGIWTGLAGVTLALAVLWRSRSRIAVLFGASGFAWAIVDHVTNNYRNARHDFLAKFLLGITNDGWLSIYLFVAGVVAVVAVDLYLVHGRMPKIGDMQSPRSASHAIGLRRLWHYLRERRKFMFLLYHAKKRGGALRAQCVMYLTMMEQRLAVLRGV